MSSVKEIISKYLSLIEAENQLVATSIRSILESKDSDDVIISKIKDLTDTALKEHSTAKKLCNYLNQQMSAINYFINANQPPLLQLSNEILLHIFSFFNQTDAAQMSGISRRFYQVAKDPMLKTLPFAHTPRRIKGHAKPITNIALFSDGRIITGSFDRTLKIWDLTKPVGQECVATLEGHTNVIKDVAILSEDKIVSVSYDSMLKVWDLTEPAWRNCVKTLPTGQGNVVQAVVALSDGKIVSIDNCSLKVWDFTKPSGEECVRTIKDEDNRFSAIAVFSDDRVVSSSFGGIFKIWDLTKPFGQECTTRFKAKHHGVLSIAVDFNDRIISAGDNGDDYTLKVWDLTKPSRQECIRTLSGHSKHVDAVALLHNGKIVSRSDEALKIWDLTKPPGQECVATLSWVSDAFAIYPDGRIVSAKDGIILIRTIKVLSLPNALEIPEDESHDLSCTM